MKQILQTEITNDRDPQSVYADWVLKKTEFYCTRQPCSVTKNSFFEQL